MIPPRSDARLGSIVFLVVLGLVSTAALSQDSLCVACAIQAECQGQAGNSCACLIKYFGSVKLCVEKGFCDEACGEPLPDTAKAAPLPQHPRIDRNVVDRAILPRASIKSLFDKEPLLALVLFASIDFDKQGAPYLDLAPSNGGTFAYGQGYYRFQLQFKKLSEDQVQFRITVREAKDNPTQTTFVGNLLAQGTAASYLRIHQDASGNETDRTHITWKAP